MTDKPPRRSNEARTAQTRAALIAAGRSLFVEDGYAATSTPEIVRRAKVTRGALYHHFADKSDLFAAIVRAEAQAVADEITRSAAQPASALDALMDGAAGYFRAMSGPGRARLLLVDGPAVLGPDAMSRLNNETSTATLYEGLKQAMGGDQRSAQLPILELSEILGAGFDRAALAIAQGESVDAYMGAFKLIFEHLIARSEKL